MSPSRGDATMVAVTAIVEHPTLDAVRGGIRDALSAAGFRDGQNLSFIFESAGADRLKAKQIAQRFAESPADVIVALSPPSARAVLETGTDRPVVIAAIADTAVAEMLKGTHASPRNVAGLVEGAPHRQQLRLIAEVADGRRTVVVPFDKASMERRDAAHHLRDLARAFELDVLPLPVHAGDDIVANIGAAYDRGRVLFLLDDPTVVAAAEDIFELGAELQWPVFAASADLVARGAIATVVYDYYDIGLQTGETIARILLGSRPVELSLRPAEANYLVVNTEAAEVMGLELTPEVRARADEIYE
ncbi:MAG: ABC transporter substrate-binding protein [Alphaproteobacteria bacterium]